MVEQNNGKSPQADATRSEYYHHGLRGTFVLALVAVALLAGITGNLLSKAFGQGISWHHISWQDGGLFGGLSPAQIDDRIDRMTKHMAIELDATAEQQAKLASIAKAAVTDLRPLQEKARAARAQAVTLLTAPTIDRSAIERLRAENIGLAETASKRIAQALEDAADALSPEQRRKVAEWAAFSRPWWARWHRG
ncbi:MAG TPA: Spy/CpxP family protein refolding chaperone [Xanthobacteraceae bacterium]|jgi:protein CpxP|nr:Spy/CpxP family protein refolding chaperone [Xanthobacteraceae bacterium]